jgi:ubiquinone/menaquinone biosynthesis C-methylase UbiE
MECSFTGCTAGYTTITNIDVSRVVIDQMIDRYKDKPTLQWQQMNVTSLEFPDETFDVVIAKATLDAVLCGEGYVLASFTYYLY